MTKPSTIRQDRQPGEEVRQLPRLAMRAKHGRPERAGPAPEPGSVQRRRKAMPWIFAVLAVILFLMVGRHFPR